MGRRVLIALLALALLVATAFAIRTAPSKLQIGVKHRPETCERKSSNGNTLSMHCALLGFSFVVLFFLRSILTASLLRHRYAL